MMKVWIVEIDNGTTWEFKKAFRSKKNANKFARSFRQCDTLVREVEVCE